MPYQLCSIQRWTESTPVGEGENRQNARHERYRVGKVRMGPRYGICPEEVWFTKTLYWIQKFGRCGVKNTCTILQVDEFCNSVGKACIFRTLNTKLRYPQTEVNNWDKVKTTFTYYHILYRCSRLQLVLKNAPRSFQCAMDIILSAVQLQFGLVHLSNVVIFSWSAEELLNQLRTVLGLLSRADESL